MKRKFDIVAVGGTFDELHKGHRALISKAFESGREVWIGLATDDFARTLMKNHHIASYAERCADLKVFLENRGFLNRAKIVPLNDSYGPSAVSGELQAIIVSQETSLRARDLNRIREKNGLQPLQIIAIDMVPAENHIPISSTRIRDEEIDREGRLLARKK